MKKGIMSDIFAILISFVISYLFLKFNVRIEGFTPHGFCLLLFIFLSFVLSSQICKDVVNHLLEKIKIKISEIFTTDNVKKAIYNTRETIIKSLKFFIMLPLLLLQFIVYLIYGLFGDAWFSAKTIFLMYLFTAVCNWSIYWLRVYGLSNADDIFILSVICGLVTSSISLILFKFLVFIRPKFLDKWY